MTGKQPDRCYVIAEAGVNHNGSISLAKELIDAAAQSGADAVKFQSFSADNLVTAAAPKARYQVSNTGRDDGQVAMLRELELDHNQTLELKAHCDSAGVAFLSTPFDTLVMRFLVDDVGVSHVKIPSGEAINGPLLLAAARTKLPIILSTGMCTMEEVEEALATLAWGIANQQGVPSGRAEIAELRTHANWCASLEPRVVLLHCVTEYPAPVDLTNLKAMDTMRDATGLPVGLSDHSSGRHIAVAAVARGAKVLEKHFTTSRTLPGPDHKASLEPDELTAMIREIRDVENALGTGEKVPQQVEFANRTAARGSLVSAAPIKSGEAFTQDNLTIKRPGTGISPLKYWDFIAGRTAARNYELDELIDDTERD